MFLLELGKPNGLLKKGGTKAIWFIDQWVKDSIKSEGSSVMGEIGCITYSESWLTYAGV